MTQVCNGLLLRSLATLRAALIELPCRLQGSVTFLARAYAMCMLVLAFNYLFAQLLMEYAQTVNEFKARETRATPGRTWHVRFRVMFTFRG